MSCLSKANARSRIFLALAAAAVMAHAPGCAPPTVAQATNWGVSFALGKLADGIWDAATGKPDVYELDRRLKRLERELAGKSPECAEPVRELRDQITSTMTRDDYLDLAWAAQREVDNRLDALERRMNQAEDDIRELQARTDPQPPTAQELERLERVKRLRRLQDEALERW